MDPNTSTTAAPVTPQAQEPSQVQGQPVAAPAQGMAPLQPAAEQNGTPSAQGTGQPITGPDNSAAQPTVDPKVQELIEWGKKVGHEVDPANEREIKLLELARTNRAYATQKDQELAKAQQAITESFTKQFNPTPQSQIQQGIQPSQPQGELPQQSPQQAVPGADNQIAQQLQAMEFQTRMVGFFAFNPDAKEYGQQIAKVLDEKPFLVNDLDAAYKIAKYEAGVNQSQIAAEQATLSTQQTIAQASAASMPTSHATLPSTMSSGNTMKYSDLDKIDVSSPNGARQYEEIRGKIDRGELKLVD